MHEAGERVDAAGGAEAAATGAAAAAAAAGVVSGGTAAAAGATALFAVRSCVSFRSLIVAIAAQRNLFESQSTPHEWVSEQVGRLPRSLLSTATHAGVRGILMCWSVILAQSDGGTRSVVACLCAPPLHRFDRSVVSERSSVAPCSRGPRLLSRVRSNRGSGVAASVSSVG